MQWLLWLAASILYSSILSALPAVAPEPIACVQDLETKFFVESIVNRGLSMYNVREELWLPINISLRIRSASVPERMKTVTAFMVPNPLEYPMQKGVTAKILKDVLYDVFREAMREYGVDVPPFTDRIFDYIFTQQLPLFVRCFGEEAKQLKPKMD